MGKGKKYQSSTNDLSKFTAGLMGKFAEEIAQHDADVCAKKSEAGQTAHKEKMKLEAAILSASMVTKMERPE